MLKKFITAILLFLIFTAISCSQTISTTEHDEPLVQNNVSSVEATQEDSIAVFFNEPDEKPRDESLQQMILDAIKKAERSIDLVTYNFTDTRSRDALIAAHKRGVQVRIVIHSENAGKDILREIAGEGIPIVASRSDGLMHSKFIIIDNRITLSGSANMTVGSFFYDNNFMIQIDSSKIAEIFSAEFEEMFSDRLFGSASPKTPAPDIITLSDGTRLLVRFSPDDRIEETLIAISNAAKESIHVLAYSFASDPLGETLISQYDAGVNVEVIFEKDKAFKDDGGEAVKLKEAGIPIYLDGSDGLMHEKVFIFDRSVVAAGSYNFTRSANQRNDEQMLIIESQSIADQFMEEYEKILIEAEPVR